MIDPSIPANSPVIQFTQAGGHRVAMSRAETNQLTVQSKSILILANRQCAGLVFPLLDDLQSAALVSPIAGSGNHAHWLLGEVGVLTG